MGSWPIDDEQALDGLDALLAGLRVAQAQPGHAALVHVEDLLDDVGHGELDAVGGARVVLHDPAGAHLGAAVDDEHAARPLGQADGLLERGVAAADDGDAAAAEEGAVARRAVGHAAVLQRLLGRQPELAGGRAGGDDDGLGGVLAVERR